MRVRTPHRGDRWLSVRATNVLDPETGELAASLGILQDVTEQKRAEDELRDLLRLNEATLQTMPSGLFVLDCDLNILKFSPMRAAGSDVDSDPIQIIGQNFADVCSESIVDQQGFLERVRRIAANGGWADVPGLVVQREGGPVGLVGSEAYVDVRIRAFDLAGEGGRPERRVLLVADDVTERVLFADRVTQTSKLESLGVLAGGIAHDFNNILTAIIACSDHVLERGETDERSRREVEEIRQAADHGAALTRQLLAFSRKQKLEPRIQSINEIIEHACAMLELILGEDVVVELDLTEDLGNVEVDRGQIEQVLVNLAANARDAMPDGGVLRIGTASVDMDADCCGSGLADRPHVLVTVSDPGVGMDEATLRKAFDPFFTTKPVGEGTGLGLASVLGIIEQHGGHVRASSAPGKGTTFSVCLPKVDGGEQTVTVGAGSKPAQGSETVLFVEDQALVRLSTKRTLEDYGYHVLCAAEPAEALVLFEQHADEIALLISDVVMPGQNGPELYRTLLDRRPDLKVLYVSGYTDHPSVGDAGVTVDAQLLEKPFAPTTLARRVRDVLDAE
jgi:signal transduction histidine kinase